MSVRMGQLSCIAAAALLMAPAGAWAADRMKIAGITGDWVAVTSFGVSPGREGNAQAIVSLPPGPTVTALNHAMATNEVLHEVRLEEMKPDGKAESTYVLTNAVVSWISMDHRGAYKEPVMMALNFEKIEIQPGR
jgi:hypothetical protein